MWVAYPSSHPIHVEPRVFWWGQRTAAKLAENLAHLFRRRRRHFASHPRRGQRNKIALLSLALASRRALRSPRCAVREAPEMRNKQQRTALLATGRLQRYKGYDENGESSTKGSTISECSAPPVRGIADYKQLFQAATKFSACHVSVPKLRERSEQPPRTPLGSVLEHSGTSVIGKFNRDSHFQILISLRRALRYQEFVLKY